MKKNWKTKPIIILIILIFIYSFIGSTGELIENLSIPIAVGCDLKEISKDDINYKFSVNVFLFEAPGTIVSDVYYGEAKSIGDTRESRQLRSNRKYLLGLERVIIISEKYAQYGIHNLIDILVNNPQINDRAQTVIFKGNVEDIMKYKVKGYSSSGEFIETLIKNSVQFNFIPQQYTTMDVIVRSGAEGRNTILPYIELDKEGIKLAGIAIFKKDKMITAVNMQEAKIINLLRENNVNGMLTIQTSPKEYINFYANSKRKVKCYKENDKFKFIIDLNLTGSIISNELYKDLYKDPVVLKQFTKTLESEVKKTCENFINDFKQNYKIDVLELGKIAVAKYGRGTGLDWNNIVSTSEIIVNVHIKIDSQGKGDY